LKTSGFVPAFILDGGCPDLWLDGGNRGGPGYVVPFFRGFSPTIIRDLCVLFSFRVLCNILYCHRLLLINEMLPGFPVQKKSHTKNDMPTKTYCILLQVLFTSNKTPE
jgi:hypothetical protein